MVVWLWFTLLKSKKNHLQHIQDKGIHLGLYVKAVVFGEYVLFAPGKRSQIFPKSKILPTPVHLSASHLPT